MKRVLITGGRAPVALDLARAFSRAGMTVFVADSAPLFLSGASRAVAKAFRVPPPRQASKAFAQALRHIIESEQIDLLVPTCEEVFYVSRYANLIGSRAELFCPPFELISQLHDKWRFSQIARQFGIHVPDTWLLRSLEDLSLLPVAVGELVFKPVFSRFAVHTLIRPDSGALTNCRPTAVRPWVAQRFIAGRELCSYSVARNGAVTAHAAYEPTWRAGRGSGYFFEPVANAMIESFVSRLVIQLGYTGQIAFDYIEGPAGQVHVLECNPRSTSGVHLFEATDPLANAFNRSTPPVVRPRGDRPAMLAPAMAMLGSVDAMKRRGLRAFARDWVSARDALWSRVDPVPSVYLYLGLAATLVQAARFNVSPQAASTRDIEWDGEPLP